MATNWNLNNPIDHTLNSSWPNEARSLKQLLLSRLFYNATEPVNRPDATAFEDNDIGSIWIDADDNIMYIMTAQSDGTPTWTKLSVSMTAEIVASANSWASLQTFLAGVLVSMSEPTITLTNTDSEDGAGERQSRIIAKGIQSGDEETTLGLIEFSHEGSADDEAGNFKLLLNDGDSGDAPTAKALEIYTDPAEDDEAYIRVANSKIILDEDDMASDSDTKLATQQSIKAHVAAEAGKFGSYASGSVMSITWPLVVTTNTANTDIASTQADTDGFLLCNNLFTSGSSGNNKVDGYTDSANPPTNIRNTAYAREVSGFTSGNFCIPVKKGEYFKAEFVIPSGTITASSRTYNWIPLGS